MLLITWKGPDDKAKNTVNFNYGIGQALSGEVEAWPADCIVNLGKGDTRAFVSQQEESE